MSGGFKLIRVYAFNELGGHADLGGHASVEVAEDQVIGHPGRYLLLTAGQGDKSGCWIGNDGKIYDRFETTTVRLGDDGED